MKTREEAIASGSPRYSGFPCPAHGEIERYTLSGNCCECSRIQAGLATKKARARYRAARQRGS